MNLRKIFFIIGTVLSITGFALMGVSAYFYFDTKQSMESFTSVQGTVTDLEIRRSMNHGSLYYPVFKFVTEDGTQIQQVGRIGSYPPAFEIGETVT